MIERFVDQRKALDRLRSNPLGEGLEDFTVYLVEGGYSRATIHLYLRTAAHFGRWLAHLPQFKK